MTSIRAIRAAAAEEAARGFTPGAIPAPVLGWNARDSLDGMAPSFAVQLDNFFPYNGFVTLRGGSQLFASGMGGPVETLARWADAATEKVVAGANGNLWEVSAGSAVSLGTGFTSNQWQWDTTKGARGAGAQLYLVNGSDTPQAYNGTAIAAVTWQPKAGQPTLTLANLHNVRVMQDVIFLAEKGELGFWHSDKGTVSPAAELSWFDLGTIVPGGGELVAMATMTLEGGEGPDDYSVFVTSTGYAILYRGTDPSQATEWALVGTFPLGRALGKRCVLEIAGDVLVLTVNGYISISQFMRIGGLTRQSFAFNDNIQPEVVRQTLDYSTQFGWEPALVPDLTLALFNVPQSSNNYVQHVVNTQTAAWSRVTGWNGLTWLSTNERLLFGDVNGQVLVANQGGVDLGNKPVVGEGLTAFSYMGTRGLRKHFQLCRPVLETAGEVQVQLALATDFDPNVSFGPVAGLSPSGAAQWNTSEWNTAQWAGGPVTLTNWESVGRLGYAAAIKMRVESTGDRCRWKSMDLSYTNAGLM